MAHIDSQDFVRRLDEHRGILFKVADAYCRSRADREDLVQTIVAELWRAFPRFDATRTFSTWMYRIAMNVAISYVRSETRRSRRIVHADDSFLQTLPDAPAAGLDEGLNLVRDVVNELEPLDRALMILYLNDNPYATIAEILGITQSNVATKIGRLKQRIKQRITASHAH